MALFPSVARRKAGLEFDKDVHIGIEARLAARHGTEEAHFADPVSLTDSRNLGQRQFDFDWLGAHVAQCSP